MLKSASFKWKDTSFWFSKGRKKSHAEVAKIYGENKSFIHEIVKKKGK